MSDLIIIPPRTNEAVNSKPTLRVAVSHPKDDCCDTESESGSSISKHNNLLELQGGTTTERYHVSKEIYDALQNPEASADNKFATQSDMQAGMTTSYFELSSLTNQKEFTFNELKGATILSVDRGMMTPMVASGTATVPPGKFKFNSTTGVMTFGTGFYSSIETVRVSWVNDLNAIE